jgi:hypothetical protein
MKDNYPEFGDKIRRFGDLAPEELENLNDITKRFIYSNLIAKEE